MQSTQRRLYGVLCRGKVLHPAEEIEGRRKKWKEVEVSSIGCRDVGSLGGVFWIASVFRVK